MEFVPWIWSPSIRITAGCSLLVSHSVLDASPSGAPFLLSHSVLDALPSGALFPLSHFDPLKCLTLYLRVLPFCSRTALDAAPSGAPLLLSHCA